MRPAQKLLLDAENIGLILELETDGQRLRYGLQPNIHPKENRLKEIISNLRTHKTEIIKELQAVGSESPDQTRERTSQIERWRGYIQELPAPNHQDGARLVKYALAFLYSPLSLEAVSLGWGDVDLFGVMNAPYRVAKIRHDAMGLIPSLAWSKLRGNLSGLKTGLVGLDEKQAYLEIKRVNDKRGSRMMKQRILGSENISIPFWESEHLTGGSAWLIN